MPTIVNPPLAISSVVVRGATLVLLINVVAALAARDTPSLAALGISSSVLVAVTLVLLRRTRALDRSNDVVAHATSATPVWIRPRWIGRQTIVLHLDVLHRETRQPLGRVRLRKVTRALDPWVSFTLLREDTSSALVSDDGRQVILVGRLDPYPGDGEVSLPGWIAEEAMSWRGDDLEWSAAEGRSASRFRITLTAAAVLVAVAFVVLPPPVIVLAAVALTLGGGLAGRWSRAPLRDLVRQRTGGETRFCDLVAMGVLRHRAAPRRG